MIYKECKLFQSVYFTDGNAEPDVSDIMHIDEFYNYLNSVYDWNYDDFCKTVNKCEYERPSMIYHDITIEWLDSLEPGDKHYIFLGHYQKCFWYIKVYKHEAEALNSPKHQVINKLRVCQIYTEKKQGQVRLR
jgi:hypothetical protein